MAWKDAVQRRYPHDSDVGRGIRDGVVAACEWFLASGLGDANAAQRLSSDNDAVYWQQLSEVLLADQLRRAGMDLVPHGPGPDFLIRQEDRNTWIEVICPEPKGLPAVWTEPRASGTAYGMPHEAMLLRWTAAIKEKADKLLGDPGKSIPGYLEKGIVGPDDAYVIAVNSRLLRSSPGAFAELLGISQFPFAAEATLCVGPYQVHLNRETFEITGSEHQYRDIIKKPTGSDVPADTFFDPRFDRVSAIWAADIDELATIDREGPMAVVHNPLARQPIPERFLPAHGEFVAQDLGDQFRLHHKAGLLSEVADHETAADG